MKTALLVLNVALTVVLLTSVTAASQQLPDTIDRVRPSIVQVELDCVYRDNSTKQKWGTAFLVSKEGFAVTAAHVVTCPSGTLASQRVQLGLPLVYSLTDQTQKKGNFKFIDSDVIEREDAHDVALLKLSRNPFGEEIQSGFTWEGKPLPLMPLGVALLSTRTVREGESVAVSGFPFVSPVLFTNAGIIASTRSAHDFNTEVPGLHVRVTSDFYLADMTVNEGNSGGPVYDASGGVIGIALGFRVAVVDKVIHGAWQRPPGVEDAYGYNAHLAVVVPIAHAKALMTKHGVKLPSQ